MNNIIHHTLNPLKENSNSEMVDKINELCHAIREIQNILSESVQK